MRDTYADMGVNSQKGYQGKLFSKAQSIFPSSFVDIHQAEWSNSWCYAHVGDGAGSKPVRSYLHWKETGDMTVFQGLAQDTAVMNTIDLMASGLMPTSFIDYISINGFHVPKDMLLKQINKGFENYFSVLAKYRIGFSREQKVTVTKFCGGETADLPYQTKTLDIAGAVFGIQEKKKIITGDVQPGDIIIGVRSGGQTVYEDKPNSGIMCNGITLAGGSTMPWEIASKYLEVNCEKADALFLEKHNTHVYFGKDDPFVSRDDLQGLSLSEAICSPTRMFEPVIKILLDEFREYISAIVPNTGGGQTKCLRVGTNIHYIKTNLIEPDPIFGIIKKSTGESMYNMLQDFNMGCGVDVIVRRSKTATDDIEDLKDAIGKLGIDSQVVGKCERSDGSNKVTM